MRSLHLQHFRCFTDFTLDLKPGINLLVGDNASGKTSLIKACQYVLSAFFAGFSDENTRWITFDTDDFQRQIVEGKRLPPKPIRITFDATDLIKHLTPGYLLKGNNLEAQILERKKPKGSRMLRSGFKAYIEYAQQLQKSFYSTENGKQEKALPLFAYYSVEDIHAKRRLNTKALRDAVTQHSLGYHWCLDGDGFFPYWIKRLLILEEEEAGHQESTFVVNNALRILGEEGCGLFSRILIRPNAKTILFVSLDGRTTPTELLSEGQKRIVAIAIDLAFRSYLLNYSLYKENTAAETTGTILIDEVDMHLHPSLQAKILPALHQAYPKMQFIVSSHAPMVMSGVENNAKNVVYKLAYNEDNIHISTNIHTYGLDLSSIVERIWDLPSREIKVNNEIKELFNLIKRKQYDDARRQLDDIKNRYEDEELAEITRAETILQFLR